MRVFICQAEDGIRELGRARGLGDVYKRQVPANGAARATAAVARVTVRLTRTSEAWNCLLYTSDAVDARSSVDLGGPRIIKKKQTHDAAG